MHHDRSPDLRLQVESAKQHDGGEAALRARLAAVEDRLALLEQELTASRAQASSDPLTGLANRRSVEVSFAELEARGCAVVVAIIDIDDFKGINDSLGHSCGDAVLTVISRTLTQAVREEDIVGRLGGDEFIILMLDVTVAQAEHRLQQILSNLAAAPVSIDAHQTWFSVSCGAAKIQNQDTLSSLMRRADRALYKAKRLGKNRVVCEDVEACEENDGPFVIRPHRLSSV